VLQVLQVVFKDPQEQQEPQVQQGSKVLKEVQQELKVPPVNKVLKGL
jgi:hypothetical protein